MCDSFFWGVLHSVHAAMLLFDIWRAFIVQCRCLILRHADHARLLFAFRSVLTCKSSWITAHLVTFEISQRLKSPFEAAIAMLDKYRNNMIAFPTHLVATSMASLCKGWMVVQSQLRKRWHWIGRVKSQSCLGGISTSTKCCCTCRCQIPLNLYAGSRHRWWIGYVDIDDELDMYTTDKVSKAGGNFDELDYWRLEQSRDPHLSWMAGKFLMICASSTPSERWFSQEKLFIPSARNRLSQRGTGTEPVLYSYVIWPTSALTSITWTETITRTRKKDF
jgi:hypothetical protein